MVTNDPVPAGADRPRISVVIPALNEEACIAACLLSLAAQDCRDAYEVVVVDNGSTDATVEIAQAHGARVVHAPVLGVCNARQVGTKVARGDIVVSTDADTTFPSTWLTQIVAVLDTRPDVVATCGPCEFVEGPWWARPYTRALFGVTAWLHRRTSQVIYASATNIAFRRDAWSGYDTTLTQGGDELGLLRNLRRRGRIHFDPVRTTQTSSRRLHRGLMYSLFVTCLYYYFGAYLLNRVAGRKVLGSAPVIREDAATMRELRRPVATVAAVVVAAAAYWLLPVDLP